MISLHVSLKTSFHGVVEWVHDSVIEEFGDLHVNQSAGTVTPEEMEDQQNTRMITDCGIELHEFPWATEEIGYTGTAAPVASGEQLPSSCYFYIEERCRIWNCGCLTNFSFNTVK